MRRHTHQDQFSPKRRRDRSNYDDQRSMSPRASNSSHYKRYSDSSRHSPKLRSPDRRINDSPDNRKTLCISKFSSRLPSDVVQEYIYREFGKFGDLSINVGNLEGERTAFLNFQYLEDARKAVLSKPTIYLHDRVVNVVPFRDASLDDRKLNFGPKHCDDGDYRTDHVPDRRYPMTSIPNKLDSHFGFLAKSGNIHPSQPPSGSTSLLGMPGIVPTAMVAAAAARALGLNSMPNVLTQTQISNMSQHLGSANRPFENRIAYSHNTTTTTNNNMSDNNSESKATRTLFVGSLEPDITETEVRDAFERYGYVEQIDIKRSVKPGVHCYAFVRFQNIDQSSRAKISMSGRCIRSLHCKIGYGKPIVSSTLYVGGLENWNSTESLQRLVTQFGPLCKLDWTPGRKFAVVHYESVESAVEAHKQLKGLPIAGRQHKRLRVDFVNADYGQMKPQQKSMSHEYLDENGSSMDKLYNYSSEHSNASNRKYAHPHRRMHDSTSKAPESNMSVHDSRFVTTLHQLDFSLQPDLWRGQFLLKNGRFYFRSLFLAGNRDVGKELISLGQILDDGDNKSHPILPINLRANLNPSWMAEAVDRIHGVLSASNHGLCLMLVLPDLDKKNQPYSPDDKNVKRCNTYYLNILIAYLKLKQATAIIVPIKSKLDESKDDENDQDISRTHDNDDHDDSGTTRKKNTDIKNHTFVAYLFAPSSFALSLLKQTAPKLSSDLATNGDYMVLMAVKRL